MPDTQEVQKQKLVPSCSLLMGEAAKEVHPFLHSCILPPTHSRQCQAPTAGQAGVQVLGHTCPHRAFLLGGEV